MPGAARRTLEEWVRRKGETIPHGFNWVFVISVDVTMVAIGGIAALQRPGSDWPMAVLAMVVAFSPWLLFFVFDIAELEALALWAAWMAGTAILLFGTSTPVDDDFAPLLLALMVGVVGSLTSMRSGFLAAVSAVALLCLAAALHRLDALALYPTFVAIGWLVGYLMHTQQLLMINRAGAGGSG